MAAQNEEERKLDRIEHKVNQIERDMKASSDDQLFFGLVLSLAVLLFTTPFSYVQQFFQDFAKFTPESGASLAQTIKQAVVLSLVASTAARYYGAIVGRVRPSKTARALSIKVLFLGWDGFLFSFVISFFLTFQFFGFMSLFAAAVVALVVFIGMAYAERKILSFYASRYLIFKKDITPFVSNLFQLLALSLYVDFLFVIFLAYLGYVTQANFVFYYILGWVVFLIVFTFLSYRQPKKKNAIGAWIFRTKT